MLNGKWCLRHYGGIFDKANLATGEELCDRNKSTSVGHEKAV